MLNSIKRLVIAATVVLAFSVPSAAYALLRVASGGSATSGQAQPPFALAVHSSGPSSQAGFQWGDAGIGAAGVLALVAIGVGAAVVIRRRVHHPLAS
jgi:hypothetical protein